MRKVIFGASVGFDVCSLLESWNAMIEAESVSYCGYGWEEGDDDLYFLFLVKFERPDDGCS